MTEFAAAPPSPGIGAVLRAFRRQLSSHRGAPRREEVLHGLDVVHARRGAQNPARRFAPETISGAAGVLHLECIEVGRGAPTVVFMPGTNAYALLYADFLAALADHGFNVVGFDPRGHGASGGRRGSYVLPELLDDMDRVVTYARDRFAGPVAVAGSSQGGITAFYYAASGAPIATAVCHNAADLADPESLRLTRIPVGLGRVLAPALRRIAGWIPELPVPMTAYLDLKREPVRGLGNARDVLYADPALVPFVRLKTLASLSREALPCPVEAIPRPVMLVHAGADTIFPEDLIRGLFRRLPEPKRLAVYPGLPHYLIVDCVDVLIDDVVSWLREMCGRE